MANFTGKVLGVAKISAKKLNGLEPTPTYSLKSINSKPYLPGFFWEVVTVPNFNWSDITYGAGLFVAVTNNGSTTQPVMTSPDGINWTQRTAPNKNWQSIIYANGLFIAIGNSAQSTSQMMSSVDGINWSLVTHPLTFPFSLAYGNGIFVVMGEFPLVGKTTMTSPDGINWTQQTMTGLSVGGSFPPIYFYNGYFIVTQGSNTQNIAYSTDGISWTLSNVGITGTWQGIGYSSFGRYALGSVSNTNKAYSDNISGPWSGGIVGVCRFSRIITSEISKVLVGIDRRTAIDPNSGERAGTTSDCYEWTPRPGLSTADGISVTSLAYGNNRIVIVGNNYAGISY